MVTAMGFRQHLPHTSRGKSWCGNCEVYRWCWFVRMLGLGFQVGVGSVIVNAQIVFISESLNDFTPSVAIVTAP